MRNKVYYSNSR